MTSFGSLLRHYRLRAGLGLRSFASLIRERASVVSAIESGRRAPWRRESTLMLVAEVLGLVPGSPLWEKMLSIAHEKHADPEAPCGALVWWWSTEDGHALDRKSAAELADFVGAEFAADDGACSSATPESLTELAVEWRVRHLLGRRSTQIATAPVDVESVLETEAGVRLEIVPGLIPRFSIQACAVKSAGHTTLWIDRIVADSRPTAAYRHLLAQTFAPAALWAHSKEAEDATWFLGLPRDGTWARLERECDRFALAALLPASPVLNAAQAIYRELVQQQGWVELEEAVRWVRNRLAEQFAVPPNVVHRRLVGWPCHLYVRIAQALAAEELSLPPADWIASQFSPQQLTLFETSTES
ncbi:MAG: helix-turn-helix domain-containing protein [Pirellulales bacterium]|nr:helix-turn-helix domain-containing protein [Pirellulales bacterium]